MNARTVKYKKEYAPELLRIARGDLESAAGLAKLASGRKETVVYLVQQAIEKCLKAMSCHLELPVLHTHDLEALVAVLPDSRKPPHAHQLGSLTEFATVRRYLEGYQILENEDVQSALELGEAIVTWVESVFTQRQGSLEEGD